MQDSELRIFNDCVLMANACLALELPTQCRHFAQATYHVLALRPITSSLESDLVLPATCTFLATKSEEKARPLKLIVSVFTRIAAEEVTVPNSLKPSTGKDILTEASVLKAETLVLKRIGFRLYDSRKQNPSGMAVQVVQALEPNKERQAELLRATWRFINDSYFCSLSVAVEPLLLAVSAICLGARECQFRYVMIPEPWWVTFGVKSLDVKQTINELLNAYKRLDEP